MLTLNYFDKDASNKSRQFKKLHELLCFLKKEQFAFFKIIAVNYKADNHDIAYFFNEKTLHGNNINGINITKRKLKYVLNVRFFLN